jgi:hypothetical protein
MDLWKQLTKETCYPPEENYPEVNEDYKQKAYEVSLKLIEKFPDLQEHMYFDITPGNGVYIYLDYLEDIFELIVEENINMFIFSKKEEQKLDGVRYYVNPTFEEITGWIEKICQKN